MTFIWIPGYFLASNSWRTYEYVWLSATPHPKVEDGPSIRIFFAATGILEKDLLRNPHSFVLNRTPRKYPLKSFFWRQPNSLSATRTHLVLSSGSPYFLIQREAINSNAVNHTTKEIITAVKRKGGFFNILFIFQQFIQSASLAIRNIFFDKDKGISYFVLE